MAFKVSGKSVNDLMNLDKSTLNNLTPKELRSVTSRLVSAVNKRIRRLQTYAHEQGIEVPSLQALNRKYNGNQFSIKGVEDKDILSVYGDIKDFMNYKTSSIKGLKQTRKEIASAVADISQTDYDELTKDEQNEIWDTYAKVIEPNKAIFYEVTEDGKKKRKSTNGMLVQAIYQLQQNTSLSKREIIEKVTDLAENLLVKEKSDEEIKEYLATEFSIIR